MFSTLSQRSESWRNQVEIVGRKGTLSWTTADLVAGHGGTRESTAEPPIESHVQIVARPDSEAVPGARGLRGTPTLEKRSPTLSATAMATASAI